MYMVGVRLAKLNYVFISLIDGTDNVDDRAHTHINIYWKTAPAEKLTVDTGWEKMCVCVFVRVRL